MATGRCLIREEVALAYMWPECLGSLGDGGRTVAVGGKRGSVQRVGWVQRFFYHLIYQDTRLLWFIGVDLFMLI